MFWLIFDFIFPILFMFVFGFIIFTMFNNIKQWNKNNNSPRLTVYATVIAKRNDVHHHHHGTNNMHSTTSTSYYVTFQVDSGDRMELHMTGTEYGMLAEGDTGYLSFQGTRFLGFDRQ